MKNEIFGVSSFHDFLLVYKFGEFLKAKKLSVHQK